MSIVIVGGPKRGKTSLGRLLASRLGLQHRCTDSQRFCRNVMGTPDRLQYDEVSGWVAEHWLPQTGMLVEGVHAARALEKHLASRGAVALSDALAPVTRVIYMVPALEPADRPGQRAQTTKVEKAMATLAPMLKNVVEFWGIDGQGGFKELPRLGLLEVTRTDVQHTRKTDEKRSRRSTSQYR